MVDSSPLWAAVQLSLPGVEAELELEAELEAEQETPFDALLDAVLDDAVIAVEASDVETVELVLERQARRCDALRDLVRELEHWSDAQIQRVREELHGLQVQWQNGARRRHDATGERGTTALLLTLGYLLEQAEADCEASISRCEYRSSVRDSFARMRALRLRAERP